MIKYQVIYIRNKKKSQSKQVATFYRVEDAFMWEKHVIEQGCVNVEIVPVF